MQGIIMTNLSSTAALDRRRFFINGTWAEPLGTETYTSVEAATGETLGIAALGSPADIDRAVLAARKALDTGPWGRSTAGERAAVMRRFARALSSKSEHTSRLVSQENGMPIWLSTSFNGTAPAQALERYADWAEEMSFEETRSSASGSTIVRREPVGVVGAIVPWNYPQALAMNKIAPALAAGCTVVLKPSEITALDAYAMAEAAEEAGLPAGVFNIVVGDRQAGAALVAHPGVDKIAFTGSTAAGRLIAAECGRQIKKATLELGGKSAGIVLDDVDLEVFVNGLLAVSLRNNGQTCTASSRILAPRSRYEEVVEAVTAFAAGMRIGNPLDVDTTCGPMASNSQLERVLGYINLGRHSDARLTTGGGRPAGFDQGWFIEPTVFADVSNADVIAREEIFGPVLVVIPYDGDDEAVAIANDSPYGLAGTVWTTDEQHGIDVARRVRTGTIGVNYFANDSGSPFGGIKASGLGRESGREAIDEYLEYKSIYVS
jgi:aldehyde dehydrogenase (NAD+)